MRLYISALYLARKLKFSKFMCSSAIHKQIVSMSLRLSGSVQCRREVYIFELGGNISALGHVRLLI